MCFWVCLILNLFNFVRASRNFVLGLNRELKNEEPKAQKNQDFGRILEEFRKNFGRSELSKNIPEKNDDIN